MLEELNYAARIVGVKQLRRALADGRVRKVFLADDADPALTDPIREAFTLAGIPVETADRSEYKGLFFLAVIPGNSICQSIFKVALRRVDRYPGILINNKNILILVDN